MGYHAVMLGIAMLSGILFAGIYNDYAFAEEDRTITVTGTAVANVKPDLLVIVLGTETRADTALEALGANNELMAQIISAIRQEGIPADEISTSNFRLRQVHESVIVDDTYRDVPAGYAASNIVTVSTSRLDLAALIVDRAVEAGANRISDLHFALSPEAVNSVYDSLIQDAVLDAQTRADTALEPLGLTTVGVKSVDISGTNLPMLDTYTYASAQTSGFGKTLPPIFSSAEEIPFWATVVFFIE